MNADCWECLGIAPTHDASEIRRAYARQLKQHRPDRDPEGFQALLQAREMALSAMREETEADSQPSPVPGPATDQPAEDHAPDTLLDALHAAVREQDPDRIRSGVAQLLADPSLASAPVRAQVGQTLMRWIAHFDHGLLLWSCARTAFGWDETDPAFTLAWPNVYWRIVQTRVQAMARHIAECCTVSREEGVQALVTALRDELLVGLDAGMLFRQHLIIALSESDGVDDDCLTALCHVMGWPQRQTPPEGIAPWMWQQLLSQARRRTQLSTLENWRSLARSGKTPEAGLLRRVLGALDADPTERFRLSLLPGRTREVNHFLGQVAEQHVYLYQELDEGAVHFWRRRALGIPALMDWAPPVLASILVGFAGTFNAQSPWPFILFMLCMLYFAWLAPELLRLAEQDSGEDQAQAILQIVATFALLPVPAQNCLDGIRWGLASSGDADWTYYIWPVLAGLILIILILAGAGLCGLLAYRIGSCIHLCKGRAAPPLPAWILRRPRIHLLCAYGPAPVVRRILSTLIFRPAGPVQLALVGMGALALIVQFAYML